MSIATTTPVVPKPRRKELLMCACCERSLASAIQTFEEDCATFPLCNGCLTDMPGTKIVPIVPLPD